MEWSTGCSTARGAPDGFSSQRAWGRPVVQRLRNALAMMACGMDADDRMVRRYAVCMVDPNTALHRLTVSGAVGTMALSAESVEEQLVVFQGH